MSDYVLEVLQDAGVNVASAAIMVALTLLAILLPICAAAYLFKKRLQQRGVNIAIKWDGADVGSGFPGSRDSFRRATVPAKVQPQDEADHFNLRSFLKTTYKVLTALIAFFLFFGAFVAWEAATPANQLLLVSGILAVLGLIALLSVGKLDRQDQTAENWRSIGQGLANAFTVSHAWAEPEVHQIGNDVVERARRMSDEGASLDEICAMISSNYAGWDQAHKLAFQQVVRAMLETEPSGSLER